MFASAEDQEPSSVISSTSALVALITLSSKSHALVACIINGMKIGDVLVDTDSTVSLLDSRSLNPFNATSRCSTASAVRSVTSFPLNVLDTLLCNDFIIVITFYYYVFACMHYDLFSVVLLQIKKKTTIHRKMLAADSSTSDVSRDVTCLLSSE